MVWFDSAGKCNVSKLVLGTEEEDKVGKMDRWAVLKKEGRRKGLIYTV